MMKNKIILRDKLSQGSLCAACAMLAALNFSAAVAAPITLRDLNPAFQSLAVGTSPDAAIAAMGSPKTRTHRNLLGLMTTELMWVDITLSSYSATFVNDRLVYKASN